MKLFLWLPNDPQSMREIIIETGDLITIEPNLGHAFSAIQRTFGLKMNAEIYDPADTVADDRIT